MNIEKQGVVQERCSGRDKLLRQELDRGIEVQRSELVPADRATPSPIRHKPLN